MRVASNLKCARCLAAMDASSGAGVVRPDKAAAERRSGSHRHQSFCSAEPPTSKLSREMVSVLRKQKPSSLL